MNIIELEEILMKRVESKFSTARDSWRSKFWDLLSHSPAVSRTSNQIQSIRLLMQLEDYADSQYSLSELVDSWFCLKIL